MKGRRPNILVISNHGATVDVIRKELEQSQTRCKLLTVSAGPATLPYLLREGAYSDAPDVDLIMFDQLAANAESLQLVQRIKRSKLLSSIPLVLLTCPDSPLPEEVQIGKRRYTTFSPMPLTNFLRTLNAIRIERFMGAITQLEQVGFVLVGMPEGANCADFPTQFPDIECGAVA